MTESARPTFVYHVVVDSYPQDFIDHPDVFQPEGWVPWGEDIAFSWPRRRNYFTPTGAGKMVDRLKSYGAEAHVEKSNSVTWP